VKKIIKLTEQDIEELVKKILKENDDTEWMGNTYNTGQHTQEEMNGVWEDLNELNDDKVFELIELTFNEKSMSVEDFVNYLPTNFNYDYDYIVSVLKQIQNEGI
jgi:hypothetical protein